MIPQFAIVVTAEKYSTVTVKEVVHREISMIQNAVLQSVARQYVI